MLCICLQLAIQLISINFYILRFQHLTKLSHCSSVLNKVWVFAVKTHNLHVIAILFLSHFYVFIFHIISLAGTQQNNVKL